MCETIMAVGKAVHNQLLCCDVWIVITKELQRRERRMRIGIIGREELGYQVCQLEQLKICAFWIYLGLQKIKSIPLSFG